MPHDSKHGYKDPRRVNDAARRAARRRVLAAYDRCAICDQLIDKTLKFPDPWSPEVDEIIPVSKGGSPTDLRNLCLTHRRCNQLKSDKSLEWARRAVRGIEPTCKPTSTPFRSSDW